METVYLILIIVLFLLAIIHLSVGVSNDAVNFLNSALGARAASYKVIMLIAALGVLIGATFSSGMMEIARSGIFHPQMFYFNEIILIFAAVIATDIILLDTFNTLGLPTSTTVSIVFELFGASVAIALVKGGAIGQYINSSKALAIISGILLSVVLAFGFGLLVQYIARLLFSFNYKKRLNYLGAPFGGFSITVIVYFMLIKGIKGASFVTTEFHNWIQENTLLILGGSFVVFTILFQLLRWLFNFNVLRIIVLSGTFALAMAFAGNDLVNFIGVPLAAFDSYKAYIESGSNEFLEMVSLTKAVQTPTYFLLAAGVIMVTSLYTSKKAKAVIETTINLSRQEQGQERFGTTQLSRTLVRTAVNLSNNVEKIMPKKAKKFIERQFKPLPKEETKDAPAFDLVRASVSLVVASILIAMGTSLKLPLSTTYVTFMVAMGTSLADRAWDRESAVYRVTGVFSVVGGWFVTAFCAFTLSFIIASFFNLGGFYAIAIVIAIDLFLIARSSKKQKKKETQKEEEGYEIELINEKTIVSYSTQIISDTIQRTQTNYKRAIEALIFYDQKMIKKASKAVDKMAKRTKAQKDNITVVISKLSEESADSGQYYVQMLDYLREIIHSLNFIVHPIQYHIDNNHKELSAPQLTELKTLSGELARFLTKITTEINGHNFTHQDKIVDEQQKLLQIIDLFRKNEIKRIKKEAGSTRNSLLYIGILQETKNLCLFSINLYKAERDFITSQPIANEFV
ncbi:MAG: inorganic phosphate transporter [Lentimicrobiaceae bacterium]|nr:inorganic phosphate transporter [Lentimicrobiaceae bacterium]